MTPEEIDQVLDEGDQIKRGKISKDGRLSITVKHNGMPGAPEVAIDEGGKRIVTAIKKKPK